MLQNAAAPSPLGSMPPQDGMPGGPMPGGPGFFPVSSPPLYSRVSENTKIDFIS